jgi:hypothetical protein
VASKGYTGFEQYLALANLCNLRDRVFRVGEMIEKPVAIYDIKVSQPSQIFILFEIKVLYSQFRMTAPNFFDILQVPVSNNNLAPAFHEKWRM